MLGEKTKPIQRQNCSVTECPRWQMSTWSKCAGKCGSAARHRRISCSHNSRELDDSYCSQIDDGKPASTDKCSADLYCPHWATGMWTDVSTYESACSLLNRVSHSAPVPCVRPACNIGKWCAAKGTKHYRTVTVMML